MAIVQNVEASPAEAVIEVEPLLQELVDFSAELPSLGVAVVRLRVDELKAKVAKRVDVLVHPPVVVIG